MDCAGNRDRSLIPRYASHRFVSLNRTKTRKLCHGDEFCCDRRDFIVVQRKLKKKKFGRYTSTYVHNNVPGNYFERERKRVIADRYICNRFHVHLTSMNILKPLIMIKK